MFVNENVYMEWKICMLFIKSIRLLHNGEKTGGSRRVNV